MPATEYEPTPVNPIAKPGNGVVPHPNPGGAYGTCPGAFCAPETRPGPYHLDPPNVSAGDVLKVGEAIVVGVAIVVIGILNPAAA